MAALICGCLPRGPLVVREDATLVSRHFAPYSPTAELPSPTPHPATPSGGPVARPDDSRPFMLVVDFQGGFFPGVTETLRSATTGVTVSDRASEDGLGASHRFSALKPGQYLMRLTAGATGDLPLLERPVAVPSDLTEHATFGWLRIELGATRSYDVQRTLGIKLVAVPSGRPIFSGPLEKFAAPGKAGEKVPLTLLLPLGSYRWELLDLQTVGDIGYVNTPAGKAPVIQENLVTLGASGSAGFTLDLRPLIRIGL